MTTQHFHRKNVHRLQTTATQTCILRFTGIMPPIQAPAVWKHGFTVPVPTRNHAIAETILNNLEEVGISNNRGVRTGTQFNSQDDYIVIEQTNMTSLIIEMGFISNETDVELYDENMDDYAAAIANGIIAWLNEYCN